MVGVRGFLVLALGLMLVATQADGLCRMCTDGGTPCPAGGVVCAASPGLDESDCVDLGCDGVLSDLVAVCGAGAFAACPPVGACCNEEGGCEEFDQAYCESTGGSYLGDGTTCEEGGCGCCQCFDCGPAAAAECGPTSGGDIPCDGVCGNLGCDTNVFSEQGSCDDPDGCVAFGACCNVNGGCLELTSDLCAERGGSYAGDGTRCGEGACGCCRCSDCDDDPPEQCGPDSGGDIECEGVCGNIGCDIGEFVFAGECTEDGSCFAPLPEAAPASSPAGLIGLALVLVAISVYRLSRSARS